MGVEVPEGRGVEVTAPAAEEPDEQMFSPERTIAITFGSAL